MVHRDIKPGNIFACRQGREYDFVKVLDFGLVKTSDERAAGDVHLTADNVVAGTPAFMAPEVATGSPVDGRADIYSLGCVAYWLLTGQPIFDEDTPLAVVIHHVQTEPVPPSYRTETEVPADLEEVILSCLAKDPGRRPQSADELDRLLAGCSESATWDRSQAKGWWQLHMPVGAGN